MVISDYDIVCRVLQISTRSDFLSPKKLNMLNRYAYGDFARHANFWTPDTRIDFGGPKEVNFSSTQLNKNQGIVHTSK